MFGEALLSLSQSARIAIDAGNGRAGLEEGGRVSAAAQCSVKNAGGSGERLQYLRNHDRHVIRTDRCFTVELRHDEYYEKDHAAA